MNEDDLCELPHSWLWTGIGEVADIIMGQSPPSSSYNKEKIGLPFYQGKTNFGSFSPTPRVWCSSPSKVADVGDVLISVRAPVGPTNLCVERSCIGRGLAAIRPRLGMPSMFMLFYLRSVERKVSQMGTGTTFNSIKRSDLESLPFPLAPLAEQERVVTKVESLFAESRTAREALNKVPVLLRRFRQSVLNKAFSGELTQRDPSDEPAQKLLERVRRERRKRWEESFRAKGKDPRKHKYKEPEPFDTRNLSELPANWVWTNIETIETFIGSGITPRGGKKVYVKDGIPFIRSQNVYPDGLHLENVAYVTPELHTKMRRTHVKPGDVLLNITGASIGRCTYIPDYFGPANVNQHVCIIRTGEWMLPQYLSSFLNSQFGQSQIFSAQGGVTREGLNYTQLRALAVPLAPVEEQKRIVDRINELFILAEEVEKIVDVARKRVETIDQAVLAKAFRGELGPQDSNDEPASTLLRRIKASVAKMQIKARKKKRKISPPRTIQRRLKRPSRSILAILKEMGQAPVEQVFQASGLSTSDFWDEIKTEINDGRIEQIRKGNSVFLKVKS